MIGIVVSGHGHFASGLHEAVRVIAGEPENARWVDFELTSSVSDLEKNIAAAYESLKDCDGVLALCDLAGGSPFKTAVQLGYPKGIESVAGCNLGMLLECLQMAKSLTNAQDLAQTALDAGQNSVVWFRFKK